MSLCIYAQNPTDVQGKWVFLKIHEQETLDSKSVEMLTKHFEKLKLNLKSKNKYDAFVNAKENGTWSLDGQNLTLKANNGQKTKMKIISVTKKQMLVQYGQGTFVMKKK